MKICATALGETAGDLLSMTMNVDYATHPGVLGVEPKVLNQNSLVDP